MRRSFSTKPSEPIVSIKEATFYRQHPTASAANRESNPPLFPNLTFELPSSSPKPEHWAIIGSSSAGKTTFFEILRGQHLCSPPTARSFPYLSSPEIERRDHHLRVPSRAIQYVGFAGKHGGGLRDGSTAGAYLSARYESRKEDTDFSVLDYLTGNIELNPSETEKQSLRKDAAVLRVIGDLKLEALVDMPVGNLSNGQTRRAKIAKALLDKPEVLLLDEPFMGLDPPTLEMLSPLLYNLAEAQAPRIVMSLRPQDSLPDWITHVVCLGPELRVAYQGPIRQTPGAASGQTPNANVKTMRTATRHSREGLPLKDKTPPLTGEPIIEMRDVVVKYGSKTVLGNWQETIDGQTRHGLQWTVRRDSRWGIFGPNGSGKTTLLSLISSDHPQSYSLPITLFSHRRLPTPGQPGISLFDLQSRIGHSSPEVHSFFPKHLSLRRTLESAWADTFLSPPVLTYTRDCLVDTHLRWFEPALNPHRAASAHGSGKTERLPSNANRLLRHGTEILDLDPATNPVDWADGIAFGALPFCAQRLALFLRALIKKPDLVILDEAFSGMDAALRDKCMLFLTWGTTRYYGAPHAKSVRSDRKTPGQVLGEEGKVEGLEERQALLVVSHVKEEVPGVVREWLCLPEAEGGGKVRMGRWEGPLEGVVGGWEEVWGKKGK
ncbi:MAG: hypothetical protein Q9208_000162 [Pyrenodesmia sp. 3 TL-2023]